jgi:hypothetical protein
MSTLRSNSSTLDKPQVISIPLEAPVDQCILPSLLLQRFSVQLCSETHISCILSKALRMTVDAPWYVSNTVIRRDLQTPIVKEKTSRYSSQYSARLSHIQMT